MFPVKKLIMLLMVLVVAAGGLGLGVQPAAAQAATCTQYHTVQRGESLYLIGQRYGVSWRTLAQINNLANPRLIFAGQRLCVATQGSTPVIPDTGFITPTFQITGVNRDQNVTIRTSNFPANDTFVVRMGRMGTRGVGGIQVGTLNTGAGGTLTPTFNIPAELQGLPRIAIRLESPTSGYFSYNWFYNNNTGTATGGGDPPTTPGYSGIPTFSIQSVVRDQSVTIRTTNFPPNLEFEVLMGSIGTRGVGGVRVGTFNSGQGGTLTQTFTIPAGLQGLRQIAIRTQNVATGYFSYNWFYNSSTQ